MKLRKQFVSLLLIFLMGSIIFITGCPLIQEKRPAPPPPNTVPGPPAETPDTRDIDRDKHLQNQETEIAPMEDMIKRMPEVNNAWILLVGNSAYVGVDLKDNLRAQQINNVKTQIAKRIKNTRQEATNEVKNVTVTADPNIVSRIRTVSQGLAEGKPISSFADEMENMTRRLGPINR